MPVLLRLSFFYSFTIYDNVNWQLY